MTNMRSNEMEPTNSRKTAPTSLPKQVGLVAVEYVVIEAAIGASIVHFGPIYTDFFSRLFGEISRVLG